MKMRAKRIAAIAAIWLAAGTSSALAQNVPPANPVAAPPAPAATNDSRPAPDLRAISDALAALQAQVQILNAQMADLRKQQKESSDEAAKLREELAATKAELAAKTPNSKIVNGASEATATQSYSSSTPASATGAPADAAINVSSQDAASAAAADQDSKPQTVDERLGRMEENQQLNEGKIDDQYQTKIESSSKYRVRLTGVAVLNLYTYRGQVDNADFPALAAPADPFGASGSLGGSLRQSRLGLEIFGPDLWGAHTSASIQFDFAGGFAQTDNGNFMGVPRLRTGVVHFDWENTSIAAGQDYLFFAPLQPTSLAQFANPALSYSGNLWGWTPQVRVEHRFRLGDGKKIIVAGGILDSLTGDFPGAGTTIYPTWGEQSNQPGYAARVAWSMPMFDKPMTFGVGAYYGRQFWGFGRYVNGWVTTADLTLPLGDRVEFTGEFFRGNAIGGFGGGTGQTILLGGNFMDPNADVDGLDAIGGWVQLKYKATKKLEFNAAFGDDSPFAHELRGYSATTPPTYGSLLTKNIGPFVNFIYQAKSNILFSAEYRYLRTYTLDNGYDQASHLSLTVAYVF